MSEDPQEWTEEQHKRFLEICEEEAKRVKAVLRPDEGQRARERAIADLKKRAGVNGEQKPDLDALVAEIPVKPNQAKDEPKADGESRGDEGPKARPVIELKDSGIVEAAVTAMGVLAGAKVEVYQRGGRLVRPVTEELIDGRSQRIKYASVIPLTGLSLKALLAKLIRWEKWTKKHRLTETNSGWEVPNLILDLRGAWPFPTLTGLLSAPTLRPDGSLLDQPGYDEATGLLLLDAPALRMKAKPTREDAEAALAALNDLISEVAFVGPADRAVALSLILSVVLRGALETAPLHLLRSPTAGSGKSFVVDIACLIATGERCAPVAATDDPNEREKRIASAMMTARELISLDNLNGELASDLLCQAITQPSVSFRPLGVSTEIKLTCRSVFAATGNNISIVGDLGRRTLLAKIDAKMEKPWERKYKKRPLEMIEQDRGRYIAAALTIPLAYMAAGMPGLSELKQVNGFDGWSRLVRGPLVWLGEADPAETIEAAREGDPKLQAAAAVLVAIVEMFGPGRDNARTMAQMVEATNPSGSSGPSALKSLEDPRRTALREALVGVAGDPPSTKLATWLRTNNGKIVGGLRLTGEEDKHLKINRWWVERMVGDFAGDAGVGGDVSIAPGVR